MTEQPYAPSISVQAQILLDLATKTEHVKTEMERMCSAFGLLSQEYLILNEAMQHTLTNMNGGTYPAPLNQRTFPDGRNN